jgi:hypothetical protein
MSAERAFVVGLSDDPANNSLVADITSAIERGRKADPGDRLDIARFESLATLLEHRAVGDAEAPRIEVAVPPALSETMIFGFDRAAWSTSLPPDILAAALDHVSKGLLPVLVVQDFAAGTPRPGTLADGAQAVQPRPPSERWDSDGARGHAAVVARFEAQIKRALENGPGRPTPISPSGVQNPIVTRVLREYVEQVPTSTRVDVPVEYRDGSRSAHLFPLRALPLRDELPAASLELRFTLLSIRHAEMDVVVDGAWLRNAEVSRPRPAAQTDDYVYDVSRRQLVEICRDESHVRILLFQTGLETAVVGFYRALTEHLLANPGSVSVQPMFFQGEGSKARGGSRHRRRKADKREAGAGRDTLGATYRDSENVRFRKGTPWAM